MMKTKQLVIATIAIFLLLIVFLWNTCGPFLMNQTMITGYVKLHADTLEPLALELLESTSESSFRDKGNIDITWHENRPDMVEFSCWGRGLLPSSTYIGFYYSENDEPIPFQGVRQELVKKGKGWAWQEPDSDNHGYTEKIMDNWYYYEAGF